MKAEEMTFQVLSNEQIKRKMAGYKSVYQRWINHAENKAERKKLCDKMESWLKEKYDGIMSENKKAIQRRAGHLSWETRRMNEKSDVRCFRKTEKTDKVVKTEKAVKKSGYSSSVSVSVKSRRSTKRK